MRVRLEGVVKRYGATAALAGVSLEIREGELFTLLGPSGCGKTTTLRILAGFVDPDEGEVYFDDVPVRGVPPAERGVGIVFQNYALWPHMTVFENVAYGLRLRRLPADEVRRRVREALEQVGLAGLEDRSPGQLSGGQQQRVAVARALVLNPRLLLLDEPLSNLDAKVRARLRSEIRRLQQDLRITTVYVTHDQEEAMVISDRIAVMRDGRVAQVGTPVDLYERPADLFVADFVGTNNLLPGTVARVQDGWVELQTPAGVVRGRAAARLEPGRRAVLAVRPEALQLSDGRQDAVALSGRVVLAQYLGSLVRYEVEVDGGHVLLVDVHNPKGQLVLASGQPARLTFHPEDALVFPGEGSP
jgi:ABC-type Fe3+/spermidine/putrescine transport system ATPase subunit